MITTFGSRKILQGQSNLFLRNFRPHTHPNPFRIPHYVTRSFHPSKPRPDVLFVSVPALKAGLLSVTRGSLLILPFWYKYKLSSRYPKLGGFLWSLPIFGICLILAIGIDQSKSTSRWRLLLMSEREELEWSRKRFEEILSQESFLILPPSDPRIPIVKRVTERLISALELTAANPISCADWPRDVKDINERISRIQARLNVQPSAITEIRGLMPWRPETTNPEKIFPRDWDIFVIDLPKVNAFVLPTKELVIYSGLLNLIEDDEDLLAAVLAHEICHVTERHAVENMGVLALASVGFDIIRGVTWAFTISFPIVTDAFASFWNFLDSQVTDKAFSRKLETEADELGLKVMAQAGYDPRAAVDLWNILAEIEKDMKKDNDNALMEKMTFLRTHPTNEDRIKHIEKHLPDAMEIFKKNRRKPQSSPESQNYEPSKITEAETAIPSTVAPMT